MIGIASSCHSAKAVGMKSGWSTAIVATRVPAPIPALASSSARESPLSTRSLQLSVRPSNGGRAKVMAASEPLSAAALRYMSPRFMEFPVAVAWHTGREVLPGRAAHYNAGPDGNTLTDSLRRSSSRWCGGSERVTSSPIGASAASPRTREAERDYSALVEDGRVHRDVYT